MVIATVLGALAVVVAAGIAAWANQRQNRAQLAAENAVAAFVDFIGGMEQARTCVGYIRQASMGEETGDDGALLEFHQKRYSEALERLAAGRARLAAVIPAPALHTLAEIEEPYGDGYDLDEPDTANNLVEVLRQLRANLNVDDAPLAHLALVLLGPDGGASTYTEGLGELSAFRVSPRKHLLGFFWRHGRSKL